MATYSFKVTKGRYQLSLTTTDQDMIVEEFEKWVRKVSDYVQKSKGHDQVADNKTNRINSEKELAQKRADEQLKRTKNKESVKEEKNVKEKETQQNLDAIFSKAPSEDTRPTIETENENVQSVFDAILDKSMQDPQEELSFKPSPSIKKDNAFLSYISSRKVERKIDYLLMTAYYFTQFENKPRFTLKQLNAKLMQNIAVILDHSVIQEGINRDYIECLPDLTGVVGASEYRLTAYGEKTLLEEG